MSTWSATHDILSKKKGLLSKFYLHFYQNSHNVLNIETVSSGIKMTFGVFQKKKWGYNIKVRQAPGFLCFNVIVYEWHHCNLIFCYGVTAQKNQGKLITDHHQGDENGKVHTSQAGRPIYKGERNDCTVIRSWLTMGNKRYKIRDVPGEGYVPLRAWKGNPHVWSLQPFYKLRLMTECRVILAVLGSCSWAPNELWLQTQCKWSRKRQKPSISSVHSGPTMILVRLMGWWSLYIVWSFARLTRKLHIICRALPVCLWFFFQ